MLNDPRNNTWRPTKPAAWCFNEGSNRREYPSDVTIATLQIRSIRMERTQYQIGQMVAAVYNGVGNIGEMLQAAHEATGIAPNPNYRPSSNGVGFNAPPPERKHGGSDVQPGDRIGFARRDEVGPSC